MTEVAIVGGGPVGLGLAIELGQRGIACTVIERFEAPSPIPRGQNLTQRTMEHMHAWGCEPQLRAARTIPPEYGMGGMTLYGTLLGEHHYPWMQRELVQPFYAQANERLPQYATEAVLRARAAEIPAIETLFGWRVTEVVQGPDGVTVTAARDGATRTLRAAYAVGCDGARSIVRDRAGITQRLSDHDRRMVLLVFRSPDLHAKLARYPGKSFFSVLSPEMAGYWKFFGRVDLGNSFFFHAPVPASATKDDDFRPLVEGAVGEPFAYEVDHVGFWDLRFAVAHSYRAGRLFIAGDAAHSHPPYGGYGINMGFEDARNLGWKLAATLQGWGGPDLLDSYSAERQPVFASLADDFIERGINEDRDFLAAHDPARDPAGFAAAWTARASGAKTEVGAFEPNYEGSPVVFGPPGSVSSAAGRHEFAARPGHHLAPLPSIDVAPGAGFALLGSDADPAALDCFATAAASLGIPLAIAARQGVNAHAAPIVLVRPDQFVAWSGASANAAATLRRAAGF